MKGILSIMMAFLMPFIFNQHYVVAQSEGIGCGTTKAMEELYRSRPDAKIRAKEFNQFTEVFSVQKSAQRTSASSYTIPVVFHVFGTDFLGASVTQAIIEDALQKTNEDFNGLNNDYGDVSALFSGRKATLDIEFALAKIDPNGNATTGVTFNPIKSGFGNGGGYDAQIQQYAWDNNKYMNIYIMLDLYADGSTNNSGVAWYPDQYMTDNNLARVVYNGRYLGSNTSENFRRVLTHEFGHFLNLAHTFDNGCSSPGDNVSDTPATTSNSGSCNFSIEKCSGAGPANGENFMDYSECYRMFTQGQVARMEAALSHSARQPLWQPSNLVATGVGGIGAHLILSSASFLEDQNNDGTVNAQATITTENGASFATTGVLTSGVHYTTTNLPPGLNVDIQVTNSSTANFTISGAANNHTEANSLNDLSVTFLDPAITGGAGSLFSPTLTMGISFIDPYQIVYEEMADVSADASATWQYFTINIGGHAYGAWYSNGDLRLETYTKSMICEGSTRNLSKLNYGDPINANSNWVAGGAYPDEHDLRTNSYTTWDGQTAYAGFQATNSQGWNIHGWFQISVSSNGDSYTVLDYAYNEDPNGTISAGQTTSTGQTPEAAFSASSTVINVGETITFSDESTQSPNNWNWTFTGGNPATSSNQNPEITYNTPGVYAVTLEVSNANGTDSITLSEYITVNGPVQVDYCESSGSRVSYEWIADVSIGSFSNNSGAQVYSDFTNQTIPLTRGDSEALTLTPGFSGSAYNEYFRVWIDYNQDGDFDDADELAFDAGAASSSAVNGSITVSASALLGATGLRVTMKYNSAPSPCGNVGDGEVEDYTVNISDGNTNPPADYCDVINGAPSGQYIKRVEFGTIDNSSTYESNGYSDYTSQSTAINSSSATTITVTPHNTWSGTAAKAWIDWNADGDFDDANEMVLSGSGSSGSYSANVSIPAGASNGSTRLRVRTLYGGTVNPCGDEYFSEVEDYTVNINGGSAGPSENIGVYGNAKIYPNPFSNYIQLDLRNFTEDQIELTLFDLSGAIKFHQTVSPTQGNINIGANLEGGFYVLQIQTDQLREVHHIVKSDQ